MSGRLVTRRRVVSGFSAVVAIVVVAGSGLIAGGWRPASAATACRVDYTVTNQWQGGFGADVTIANLGDAVSGWTLTWSFGAGQTVTQAWNATVTQSGAAVTATNVSYNAAIATNGSVNFGFNGAWGATNPAPTAFTLNGTLCTGTPAVSTCAAPTPTTPAPTTPPTPATTATTATPSRSPVTSPAGTGKVTVWMAGDSTMANPSAACPVGWGSQFGAYFTSNATVVNSAVAGRSIQTWLYDPNVTTTMDASGECVISPVTYSSRWAAMLNATTGMKAGDYLLIQFGINDADSTCNRHVGSARFTQLLTMMAQAAQTRGAHPIFLTSTAAITCSGSTAVGNRGFLTETFAAGTANNVPVIDLHKLSYTLYNTLQLCPNNGDYTTGAVGAFFCNDHTHFEAEGARQIAGLVATALRNQSIPLAAYLK